MSRLDININNQAYSIQHTEALVAAVVVAVLSVKYKICNVSNEQKIKINQA